MKCPKCSYLGFDQVDRCRNCGYDFSLVSPEGPELALRTDPPAPAPLDDLELTDRDGDLRSRASGAGSDDRRAPDDSELPLFGTLLPGDAPLITRASPPRQPLAVRRATPDTPRLRASAPRTASLDLAEAEAGAGAGAGAWASRPRAAHRDAAPEPAVGSTPESATMGARAIACAIDLGILALIDLAVVYLAMQISGLTLDDLGILPVGPLVAFLILQNGGYLVAFTAGGQTLGMMIAGIRVVSADPGAPLAFGQSLVRTLVWAALAVPVGLGLLTTLMTADHRGLHDRCAGTKVVRAAA